MPSRRFSKSALSQAIQVALFSGALCIGVAQAQVVQLAALNGADGFRLDGVAGDYSGRSVAAAGDINGDGRHDLIIGAYRASTNGESSGSSYVVFGRSGGFASSIDLSSLNGSTGFRLDGVAADDLSGGSVAAAGDVNGDGRDDLIIGANSADPNGNNSGSSYVVFGRSTGFAASINLSSLNGSTGFRLDGSAFDYSGCSVAAAGDINGDGRGDLIIGANIADPNGMRSGSSYVVFGRSTGFAAAINLSSLDGSTGFRLDGMAAFDFSGQSVAAAADINGDGRDDLVIGSLSGSSYVVFGRSTGFAAAINLSSLNGSTGFRLDGAQGERSGISVAAAGDINGDGRDDLIVGADRARTNGEGSGSTYVVFGRSTGFAAAINLSSLDGSTGFRLDGAAAVDYSGRSVAAAGDVNGDGRDDLIIGSYGADPNGSYSGSSYVVFGRSTGFAAAINLASLNGSTGFRLDGAAGGYSGRSVAAAGDVNGDGRGDLIIGADKANSSYVVFGAPQIGLDNVIFKNGFEQ